VVADEDGVVCVPVDVVQNVVDFATEGREVDAKCLADIRAGRGVQQTFKTQWEIDVGLIIVTLIHRFV